MRNNFPLHQGVNLKSRLFCGCFTGRDAVQDKLDWALAVTMSRLTLENPVTMAGIIKVQGGTCVGYCPRAHGNWEQAGRAVYRHALYIIFVLLYIILVLQCGPYPRVWHTQAGGLLFQGLKVLFLWQHCTFAIVPDSFWAKVRETQTLEYPRALGGHQINRIVNYGSITRLKSEASRIWEVVVWFWVHLWKYWMENILGNPLLRKQPMKRLKLEPINFYYKERESTFGGGNRSPWTHQSELSRMSVTNLMGWDSSRKRIDSSFFLNQKQTIALSWGFSSHTTSCHI